MKTLIYKNMMISLQNPHALTRSFSRTFSAPKHLLHFPKPSPLSRFTTKITMSSSASANQTIVEHVVLFKVRDDAEPSKVNEMVNKLNGLASLNLTFYLTTGPVLRTGPSPVAFTHLLHGRYTTVDDLNTYSVHPSHLGVVKDFVFPNCDEVVSVDWVNDHPQPQAPRVPPPGSAIRFAFLKLKKSLEEESKSELLAAIKGTNAGLGDTGEVTIRANVPPEIIKGYSVTSLVWVPGASELERVDPTEEEVVKEKVKEYLESEIVLDYVVPSV